MNLSAHAIPGIKYEITPGDKLAELIATALRENKMDLCDGDILAVAQKAVSKAEGRVTQLESVSVSDGATKLADRLGRDAKFVQVVMDESREIVRAEHVIISETHHGFICANAGVDQSNTPEGTAVLLPQDPDRSAREIRAALQHRFGTSIAVVITDTFGRPWRLGQTDVAIGCAGIGPLDGWEGRNDRDGRPLRATAVAVIDAIAATADMARSKDSSEPAVIVRGLERFITVEDGPGAVSLVREQSQDLFR